MQNQERQERNFGRIFSSGAEFVKNAKSEVHRTGASNESFSSTIGFISLEISRCGFSITCKMPYKSRSGFLNLQKKLTCGVAILSAYWCVDKVFVNF